MEQIAPHLHATEPVDLGFGETPLTARAFLLQRPSGNITIYNAAPMAREPDTVRRLGGIDDQYLNHVHEASPDISLVHETFGAPLHLHAADADEAGLRVAVDQTFTERHRLDDFEVIPIPGHTPGATAFLWKSDGERFLFTGDSVYLREGDWKAAFLDATSDRPSYVASLELLADLEFDRLVPGIAPAGGQFFARTDPADSRRRLVAIAERLRAGGDR